MTTGRRQISMQKCSFIFICIFWLMMGLTACKQPPDAYDTQGNPVLFDAFKGQYIVINYFAGWCKPCWMEMPVLNAFYHQHAGKVKVFGVNYDQSDNSHLKTLIQKMGIDFPVLTSDPGKKFGIISAEGLPMTVIINPEGKKTKILMGEQTTETLTQAIASP
jgi:thiol-disulfide isomerase/thioredoxin